MKNRLTRPQVNRELAYFRLRTQAVLTSTLDVITFHRRKILLGAAGILFLVVLGVALVETQRGDQSTTAASSAASSTTEPTATTSAPAPSTSVTSPPPPPVPPAQERPAHVVTPGETLASVAVLHDVPAEQIAADNGLRPRRGLTVGQRLVIGVRPAGIEVVAPGTTLTSYAHRLGLSVERLAELNPQLTDPDLIVAGNGLHIR
ncbi:LysM peptidoglycan-binding domain-containing protein [Amycolatopsis sp. H20-H5]|uniref:LysM peptidoglycan-binding domain-containing protein n=1 Tax=Amycolatopsis sp. H20-H5 TaxID=3046309 RepID=UPI002DBFAE64|nr:LysM domain-containing protein [Amycolatopsis sp. H20-H5]MEC3976603.1 LysM domain-containing protein [Amycolatopsis sp. H20-H5]